MPRSFRQSTCQHCGKLFELKYGMDHPFCSRSCGSLGKGGEKHNHWKGGRLQMVNGYIVVRVNGKYVYEHRHVMSQQLGRPLQRNEAVHHKNHDRTDNRPENLELKNNREHSREHAIEFHERGVQNFGFKSGQQAWKLRKSWIAKQQENIPA